MDIELAVEYGEDVASSNGPVLESCYPSRPCGTINSQEYLVELKSHLKTFGRGEIDLTYRTKFFPGRDRYSISSAYDIID